MPTKFNLNIDSRTSDDMSGDGVTQNTNIRSEDPNELIAVLQKLSGQTPAHAHETPVATPTVQVTAQELPANTMRAIMQKSGLGSLPGYEHAEETPCGAVMEAEEEEEEEEDPTVSPLKKNRTGNYSRWAKGYDDAQRDLRPDPRYAHSDTYMRGFKKGLDNSELDVKAVNPYEEPDVSAKRRGDSMSASGRERDYEGDPEPLSGEFDFSESTVNEALANAPKPKTMKDLMGIVNTDHTASIPNKTTKAGHGDNPLVPADDEESLLESRLMNEWRSDKIQHYAEELNRTLANKAIVENLDSFVDGTREYAVRQSDGFIKVYPIIENRVMTQSPVYVVQEAFGRDMKHLVGDTGPGKGRGVSPELSRNNEFSPDKLADLDVPAAQRAGMEPAEHPKKPSSSTHGRGRPMPVTEQEEGNSVRELWNKFARHVAISRDDSESTEIRSRARREAEDLYLDTAEEYGTHMAVDMKKYATHKLSYDQTGNRKHDEIATDLLARYAHDEPKSSMDSVVEPADDELDNEIPAILRRQAGESVNEAKKKKAKNKYAIGMAAAMTATGDKPPLKKSTITKAHEIAKAVKEGSKKK